ncbi:MAG: zinc metalloprotease HtpX [Acidimicrobiia bacterium]|nr:zinc metalloprotease HtpX [Acidimicrobiia bacterium]
MYDQIAQNKRRSIGIVVVFVLLVALVLQVINLLLGGGIYFGIIALLLAGGSAALSYWKSDAIALRVSKAKPASPEEYQRLHNIVEGLCIAGGLPKPRVYVVEDSAPNAFATGRDPKHAAIAVTTGLLERMNRVELEGVIAHELSHIKNYDILVSTLVVTMVGIIAIITDVGVNMMFWSSRSNRRSNDSAGVASLLAVIGFVFLIFSPLIARALQASVSRQRESLADISGVELTRFPPGLISALEKLRDDNTEVRSISHATAHLWIEQPQAIETSLGRKGKVNRMFDTHPPIEERIALLREL